MKKLFFVGVALLTIFTSCNEVELSLSTSDVIVESNSFEYDGVTFTISSGCPFETKGSYTDLEFQTINAKTLNKEELTLVIGEREISETISQNVVFDEDGDALLKFVVSDDELVEIEPVIANYQSYLSISGGEEVYSSQTNRRSGEKYLACVKRVFHEFLNKSDEMKETDGPISYWIREKMETEVAAVYAIITCY